MIKTLFIRLEKLSKWMIFMKIDGLNVQQVSISSSRGERLSYTGKSHASMGDRQAPRSAGIQVSAIPHGGRRKIINYMPERIDKLTKKQEAAMPAYAKKWIDIGLKTGDADWDTFDKYMPICYAKAGIKYPTRVVHVASPLVGALASSIAEAIYKKYIRNAVYGAVSGAVDGAVSDAVYGAVGGAVHGAVGDAVSDAVHGAVGDAVHGAVGDAVGDAVRNAVGDAVRSAVDGAVGGAVRSAVYDVVSDAVDGAVHAAVGDAVNNAAVSIIKKLSLSASWHFWLGGQFWVGYGWYWGVSFINFLFDECGLKLSKDTMERAEAYRKINESVNYIWPNRDFVIVCDRPKHILRDEEGRLHSTEQKAIEYKDGWGLYMIHGVKFTEEQFNKAKTATIAEILSWEDIDQRSVLLRERPIEKLLEEVPKKLLDHSEECGGYDLWEIELPGIGKAKILSYKGWSSEKPYIKFVPSDSTNALETVAMLRHQTVDELNESIKS